MIFGTTSTTTAAKEVLIAVGALNLASPIGDSRPTNSWSNGFFQLSFSGAYSPSGTGPPFTQMLGVAIKFVTSTGAYTTTWNFNNSGSTLGIWNALIATYK
jgi:hypothetical protein